MHALVDALRDLHRAAGKPSARRVSRAIRDEDELPDTVSHETISGLLRGDSVPRWIKVECVVRVLAGWAVDKPDPDAEVRRIHQLWLSASDPPAVSAAPRLLPPAPVPPAADVAEPIRERPAALPPVTNVPVAVVPFTGRENVLESIRAELTNGPAAPLALIGPGGVGKTQLVLEYARRWAADYDVVWWIPAEQPSPAIVALGEQLEVPIANDVRRTVRGVLSKLEDGALRWLLIYDNAAEPDTLTSYLPAIGGHVLVTSRQAGWSAAATAIDIGVFTRAESLAFLRRRGAGTGAEALAAELGDLPLALGQFAAMQRATGMPVAEYLRLFREHQKELLAVNPQPDSQTAIVTTFVKVAFTAQRAESPAAAQLLLLLAFMAPHPVALALLHRGRDAPLTPPLGRVLHDREALSRTARQAARFGLAQLSADDQQLQMHRLVQVELRRGLEPAEAAATRLDAHRLLAAANPGDPDDQLHWTRLAEISPHLVSTRAVNSTEPAARRAVLHQIRYLERVGDFEASAQVGTTAVETWRKPPDEGGLGPDHELTLLATRHLANALRALGFYTESRAMIMDTFERLRREFGDDHPHTLSTAAVAAFYLRLAGSYREALDLDQFRVDRLTEDGPQARSHLAIDLRLLGRSREALPIDQELLGLISEAARNLARDEYDLGRYQAAYERLVDAPRHRADDAVIAARTQATVLRKLGRYAEALIEAQEAYRLGQDRFGPDHHLTLAAVMTYANTLRAAGEPATADEFATEALDRYRRLFGADNPLTLAAATNHAIVLRALGRWREAHGVDERTLDETRRVLGPDHPHVLATAVGLATDLARNHDETAAAVLGRATVDALRQVRGDDHPDTWACTVNLRLDERDSAGHGEALGRLAELLGADHPEVRAAATGARLECDIEPPPT